MNLLDVLSHVRRHLEENGRLSLRMIRRQFEPDEDFSEEVIEELVDVQSVARREGNVLVWAGASAPTTVLGNANLARVQLLEALSRYPTTSATGRTTRLEAELNE